MDNDVYKMEWSVTPTRVLEQRMEDERGIMGSLLGSICINQSTMYTYIKSYTNINLYIYIYQLSITIEKHSKAWSLAETICNQGLALETSMC